jgi:hypothetical protein
MATTFVKIQTVTVGVAGVANIEFTSIPQNYTDLQIVASIRCNVAFGAEEYNAQFNGTTTNLSYKRVVGVTNTGAVSSDTSNLGYVNGNSATASIFSNTQIYIPNYTSSNFKSFSQDSITEDNATATRPNFTVGLWSNTAAITSVKLISSTSATILQYSTATLYGIKSS